MYGNYLSDIAHSKVSQPPGKSPSIPTSALSVRSSIATCLTAMRKFIGTFLEADEFILLLRHSDCPGRKLYKLTSVPFVVPQDTINYTFY